MSPGDVFIKAVIMEIHKPYIRHLSSLLHSKSSPLSIRNKTAFEYIGAKSTSSRITSYGLPDANQQPIFSYSQFVVHIDSTTGMPAALKPEWKAGVLAYMKNRGIDNKMKVNIPDFPKQLVNRVPLFSYTLHIQREHVDFNNHVNYITYVMAGVVCVNEGINKGRVPGLGSARADDVVIHEMATVYVKPSVIGDDITLMLYESENDSKLLYVSAINQHKERVSYYQCRVQLLADHRSKL